MMLLYKFNIYILLVYIHTYTYTDMKTNNTFSVVLAFTDHGHKKNLLIHDNLVISQRVIST